MYGRVDRFFENTSVSILQAKIQKHQAFEAEVAAHSNAIVVLDNTGKEMISQNHFASDKIRERLGESRLFGGEVSLSISEDLFMYCILSQNNFTGYGKFY
jgi:predicted proteasome-type protease